LTKTKKAFGTIPTRRPTYVIRNDYGDLVQVEVAFVEHENTLSNPALPHRFIVPIKAELSERTGFLSVFLVLALS
jgi:hypothetical protein